MLQQFKHNVYSEDNNERKLALEERRQRQAQVLLAQLQQQRRQFLQSPSFR